MPDSYEKNDRVRYGTRSGTVIAVECHDRFDILTIEMDDNGANLVVFADNPMLVKIHN